MSGRCSKGCAHQRRLEPYRHPVACRAKPGEAPEATSRALDLVHVPTQIALYGIATLPLLGYGISRAGHTNTLSKLAAAADLAQEGEPASSSGRLS